MRRRHFLADLPLLVRNEVFKYIDYETRTRLRGLSRRTREMIDTVPIWLDRIETSVDPFYINIYEYRDGARHQVNLSNWTYQYENMPLTRNQVDEVSIQTAFEKLAVILRNPNLQIDEFSVGAYGHFQRRLEVTKGEIYLSLNLLKLILGSLRHQIRSCQFEMHFESGEHEVTAFLPHFQPGYLKSLKMWTRCGGVPGYEQISRTEHWTRLQHLLVRNPPPTLSIEDFWHIPYIELKKFNMSTADLDRLIYHYLNHREFIKAVFEGVRDRWVPTMGPEWVVRRWEPTKDSNKLTVVIRNPNGQRLGLVFEHCLESRKVEMHRHYFS